jgi:hypothetical protein
VLLGPRPRRAAPVVLACRQPAARTPAACAGQTRPLPDCLRAASAARSSCARLGDGIARLATGSTQASNAGSGADPVEPRPLRRPRGVERVLALPRARVRGPRLADRAHGETGARCECLDRPRRPEAEPLGEIGDDDPRLAARREPARSARTSRSRNRPPGIVGRRARAVRPPRRGARAGSTRRGRWAPRPRGRDPPGGPRRDPTARASPRSRSRRRPRRARRRSRRPARPRARARARGRPCRCRRRTRAWRRRATPRRRRRRDRRIRPGPARTRRSAGRPARRARAPRRLCAATRERPRSRAARGAAGARVRPASARAPPRTRRRRPQRARARRATPPRLGPRAA